MDKTIFSLLKFSQPLNGKSLNLKMVPIKKIFNLKIVPIPWFSIILWSSSRGFQVLFLRQLSTYHLLSLFVFLVVSFFFLYY